MNPAEPVELYICVDIETSGPIPVDYSLLSIGACTVIEPQRTFYIELKPINENSTPESANIHKLSLERLMKEGESPVTAMQRFEGWILEQASPGKIPVFVGFNASFDWMFINYYFQHYLGRNPFGYAALDIKAYYMGQSSVPWSKTSWRLIAPQIEQKPSLVHHALQDALDQAQLFKQIFKTKQT